MIGAKGALRGAKGFTLTELMAALAVVAILAAVAVPAYTQFTADARRTEGQSALTQAAVLLERFHTENSTYTADLTQVGLAAAGWNQTERGFYQFRVEAATGGCPITTCYVLRTQPRNGSEQWGDDFWYELWSDGNRRSRACPKDVCGASVWVTGWSD